MTLEEAIKHAREVALSNSACGVAYRKGGQTMLADGCDACATEHEQLAKWLTELKQRREAEISEKPKTNGDKVREALSKLSDYKISHLEFCNLYDECDECPMNRMEKCMDTARARQLWLKQEVSKDD